MTHKTAMTAKDAQTHQEDPPNAVFPPFKRGRTGIRGRTKYIQCESGSWVTFNEDGSCHIGARHKYLGNLLEVAGELEQRKEYADAWRINMQRAERELAAKDHDLICKSWAKLKELEPGVHITNWKDGEALVQALVNEFLRWPLPDSVCADGCATKQGPGRVGTNLLTAVEAEAFVRGVALRYIEAYATALIAEKLAASEADSSRLTWLCEYISAKGTRGIRKLAWSLYDDDGARMNHLKKVCEDDVADLRFDRAAIDDAIKEDASINPKT